MLRGDRQALIDERSALFDAFEAVRDALRSAAATQPLMLFVDDIQVADPATWTLLTMLTDDLASMAVLMIVAARDEGDREVTERMTDLLSRRGTERLAMRGLDLDDVEMFARRFPGAEHSDDLTVAFHERTAGNPYFLTQLAATVEFDRRRRPVHGRRCPCRSDSR